MQVSGGNYLQFDLQPHFILERQQRLGIPLRIVHGVMRMFRLPQVIIIIHLDVFDFSRIIRIVVL
jgi:hypothetical protein